MPAKKKKSKTAKKPVRKAAPKKKVVKKSAPPKKKAAKKAVKKTAAKTPVAANTARPLGAKVTAKASPKSIPPTVKSGPLKAAKTAGAGTVLADRPVTLTDGTTQNLAKLAGPRGLVLYFYPKDQTPGCTREACDFRDNQMRLKSMGFGVAGVSPDSVKSHQSFTAKQSLNFPLIADVDKKLCEELGVWQEKSLYGRSYMGVARTTFVLSPDLRVTKVYGNVKVDGHVTSILNDLATG